MAVAIEETVVGVATRRIVERFGPEKVILFGSRARGDARDDSDYDLLIIAPSSESKWRRTVPVYRELLGLSIPIDVVWWTPEEIEEWSTVRSHFINTALREGKTLYVKDRDGSCPIALEQGES